MFYVFLFVFHLKFFWFFWRGSAFLLFLIDFPFRKLLNEVVRGIRIFVWKLSLESQLLHTRSNRLQVIFLYYGIIAR